MVPNPSGTAKNQMVTNFRAAGSPSQFQRRVLFRLNAVTSIESHAVITKLRFGRSTEVEELCQPVLKLPGLPTENRATVLATIALARKAQGQPCEQLLAEAVALAPTADLVPEAAAAAQLQPS